MKHRPSLVAVAAGVALALVTATVPAHAVYQKVETYQQRYAMIDAWDCTPTAVTCTEVFVTFGFDEASAVQPFASLEMWSVDRSGPVPDYELVAVGGWYDAALSITVAANRRTASLSGYVQLDTQPCDMAEMTCSGPTIEPFVEAVASASVVRSGVIRRVSVDLPPACRVTRAGTYVLRRSRTGSVSLDGVTYGAVPVSGSVVIERDNVKVTWRDCLTIDGVDSVAVAAGHLASQRSVRQAPVRHLVGAVRVRR